MAAHTVEFPGSVVCSGRVAEASIAPVMVGWGWLPVLGGAASGPGCWVCLLAGWVWWLGRDWLVVENCIVSASILCVVCVIVLVLPS